MYRKHRLLLQTILGSLEDRWSWCTFWKFLIAWRCHVSIFRCLVCQEVQQEDPYPPSPGWILGGQVVPLRIDGSWHTIWGVLVAWRCHNSNFRCLRCQEPCQEGLYPPSSGWILEGQLGSVTFQIGISERWMAICLRMMEILNKCDWLTDWRSQILRCCRI